MSGFVNRDELIELKLAGELPVVQLALDRRSLCLFMSYAGIMSFGSVKLVGIYTEKTCLALSLPMFTFDAFYIR